MEQEEDWNRFASTGRVDDYLNYRKVSGIADADAAVNRSGPQEKADEGKSGDIEPDADGQIRGH